MSLHRPLEGITVVAMEQAVAAPFASRQLADLGARVIKIERADGGDFARAYDSHVGGTSSAFLWLNRGKESLVLDIKSDTGAKTLEELLTHADVFIQNLSPAAARRAGLDPDSIQARHPSIIPCAISGYGDTGPLADAKAYDLLVQGETGMIALTGEGQTMAKVGISIADIAAGSYAYSSVLAALMHRFRYNESLSVKISLFDALSEWLGYPLYYALYGGEDPKRRGTSHATIAPYGAFRTGDDEIVIFAVQNEREWYRFCDVVLQAPALSADPRFDSQQNRVANSADLDGIIMRRFTELDQPTAVSLLAQADLAVARLNPVSHLVEHEQMQSRERWIETDTPAGTVRTILPPWQPDPSRRDLGAVPALGEHTGSILEWLSNTNVKGRFNNDDS